MGKDIIAGLENRKPPTLINESLEPVNNVHLSHNFPIHRDIDRKKVLVIDDEKQIDESLVLIDV